MVDSSCKIYLIYCPIIIPYRKIWSYQAKRKADLLEERLMLAHIFLGGGGRRLNLDHDTVIELWDIFLKKKSKMFFSFHLEREDFPPRRERTFFFEN